jgi:hypothetical protein
MVQYIIHGCGKLCQSAVHSAVDGDDKRWYLVFGSLQILGLDGGDGGVLARQRLVERQWPRELGRDKVVKGKSGDAWVDRSCYPRRQSERIAGGCKRGGGDQKAHCERGQGKLKERTRVG